MGDALDDHMFTDVSEGHVFTDAINCIAYYGVTSGTGDGSTYSPNDEVTRAQMAVFIARAATAAGVDLGSGSGGFNDLDGVWSEAQDAINQLAAKGMISAGGAFRPDDAITRAEMATFLFGLLLEASPIVSLADRFNRPCAAVSGICSVRLGDGASALPVNDWFPDARDSLPLEVDRHVSAMWELGVTGGAENLPPGPDLPDVLVSIKTHAFVGSARGARPVQVVSLPLSFDEDGKATFPVSGLLDPVPYLRGDKYDTDITIQDFPIDQTPGPFPLPHNYVPQGTVNRGQMAAFIARALAHTTVRPSGVTAQYERHEQNVIVSVRDGDFQPVSNAVVDVFHIDVPGADLAFKGDGSCGEVANLDGKYACEIDKTDNITGGAGDVTMSLKPPILDSVHGTTVWAWTGDDEDEVDVDDTELYPLDIPGGIYEPPAMISVSNSHGGVKAHLGSSVEFTLQIRDKYGNAAADFDEDLTFVNGIMIPLSAAVTDALPAYNVLLGPVAGGGDPVDSGGFTGVFSTEDSLASGSADVSVSVGPEPLYVAANARGAATRVKVTVVDQYGDPLPGREVRLSTSRTTPASQLVDTDDDNTVDSIVIASNKYLAVDRSGSYTFGYERSGDGTGGAESDMLTADVKPWDHDGDGCTQERIDDAGDTGCIVGSATVRSATVPLTPTDGMETMQWASAAGGEAAAAKQILRVDTDTDTIFVGVVDAGDMVTDRTVEVIYYDSNDRFNIVRPTAEEASPDPDAVGYAEFERSLFNLKGFMLSWDIVGTGSRDVNGYTLTTPALADIDAVIYW